MSPQEREQLNRDFARLADGDRSAAEGVFAQLWPVLRSFSARALGDDTRAQDVAQQALLKLFEQASRFDPSKDALAWALEICAWEIRTERRRMQRLREEPWEAGLDALLVAQSPEQALSRSQLLEGLSEAFSFLSANDQETLSAVLLESTPPVSGATWRKRKQRAISRLKAAWGKVHEKE